MKNQIKWFSDILVISRETIQKLCLFLSFFICFFLLFFFSVFQMDVGHGCFIHIKVFNGPTGKDNYELHGYQTDKTKDDELTYF